MDTGWRYEGAVCYCKQRNLSPDADAIGIDASARIPNRRYSLISLHVFPRCKLGLLFLLCLPIAFIPHSTDKYNMPDEAARDPCQCFTSEYCLRGFVSRNAGGAKEYSREALTLLQHYFTRTILLASLKWACFATSTSVTSPTSTSVSVVSE